MNTDITKYRAWDTVSKRMLLPEQLIKEGWALNAHGKIVKYDFELKRLIKGVSFEIIDSKGVFDKNLAFIIKK